MTRLTTRISSRVVAGPNLTEGFRDSPAFNAVAAAAAALRESIQQRRPESVRHPRRHSLKRPTAFRSI